MEVLSAPRATPEARGGTRPPAPAPELMRKEAAREVWRYSVESARSIFGDEVRHPDSQKVLEALAEARAGRMTRSEVAALFHRNRPAADLTRLRDRLIRAGRIEAFLEQPEVGKKTEWWCGR